MAKIITFNYDIPSIVAKLNRKSDTSLLKGNRDLFSGAATLICELKDRLVAAERDRASMAEILKEDHGCSLCKHWRSAPAYRHCASCREGKDKPNWEWNGGRKWTD